MSARVHSKHTAIRIPTNNALQLALMLLFVLLLSQSAHGKPSCAAGGFEIKGVQSLCPEHFPNPKRMSQNWFVLFYAPWCGHCKNLQPSFQGLSNSARKFSRFGAVDCTQHRQLCSKFGVKGFPSLQLLQPETTVSRDGDEGSVVYKGARDVASMSWFLQKNRQKAPPSKPKKSKKKKKKRDFGFVKKKKCKDTSWFYSSSKSDVLNLCPDVFPPSALTGEWIVKFYTSWSDASIKFKKTFKNLAAKLKDDDLKFGAVDCGLWGELCTQHGVNTTGTQFPVLHCFSGGKSVMYNGELGDGSKVVAFCSDVFKMGPHNDLFERFLIKLSAKGFFGGAAEGTPKYTQLLRDARKRFFASIDAVKPEKL